MFSTFCYVVFYYNIDNFIKNLYLYYINPIETQEVISNQQGLFFLLNATSCFMLALYSYTLVQRLFIPQRPDKHSTALIFVYLKHILPYIFQTYQNSNLMNLFIFRI